MKEYSQYLEKVKGFLADNDAKLIAHYYVDESIISIPTVSVAYTPHRVYSGISHEQNVFYSKIQLHLSSFKFHSCFC